MIGCKTSNNYHQICGINLKTLKLKTTLTVVRSICYGALRLPTSTYILNVVASLRDWRYLKWLFTFIISSTCVREEMINDIVAYMSSLINGENQVLSRVLLCYVNVMVPSNFKYSLLALFNKTIIHWSSDIKFKICNKTTKILESNKWRI